MPAFTAIGAYVAGTLLGLVGTAALVVGAVVATGAAYITSRIINGNPNKGNNSASNQGGRIQVPPATNNKIPVVYGSAYVNGIITDARLKSLGGTTNDTMYYCLVLSEYTNNLTPTPSYGIESVLWNDLRLTAVDTTTNAHKVKDGRKVVNEANLPPTNAGSFVVGKTYIITERGTTDFTNIGAQTNNIGQIFTATGVGTGTGNAQEEDFIDTNFVVDSNSLVELRVYAGSSAAADQIYPPQSSSNTTPAYTFWANNDGSWDSTYAMDGLVFAIVKLTYNGDKGFTALPNVTFQLANNVSNPADVWYDYMTSKRYGAGIDPADIDTTARTTWYNFCEEDINYTNVAGETNQSTLRYNINGVIDTSNQVKTNIDTILQNGGAWMSYDVSTGLWSPVIKKAINAGTATDAATLFTASRSGSTLTVATFPSGRIEPGQLLYNSTGTLIGTITAQITPLTAGETTGQIGRYTTSSSGTITTTTFYTLPASTLEFSDDNIISGITISSTRLEDLYNEVEAEFYNRYNKDQRAYARNYLDAGDRNPNEPDNQLRMSLDLVNNSMQADILGQIEMRQSRDDLVIEFTSTHYGIQTQAGDVVAVTSELYGWDPKYFRVMRVKEIENEDASLTAQIQALEYNPDVYTIEPITEFSTSANIGIGNLVSSRGLPKPEDPLISDENPNDSVPNFTFSITIPATGGPFDEAEIYVAEGWDPNSVTGTIVPGTGSNGVAIGKGLMTVTAVTYNSINVGDYFDLGGVTVESQLTQTTISTKTFSSGGAIGAKTFILNNVTGVVIGQKPTGTGIPTGAMVVGVSGTTVTLDKAFTVQAAGSYLFTTAGGTGTYQVNISTTASGTDDLFDQPVDSDFRYLKKIVPDGNAAAFTSGSTISTIITELPANSFTFRRYFLKSRLGVKKNFGEFSENTPVDLDGNSIPWNPNSTAAGALSDLTDVNITSPSEGNSFYYDATTSKWRNTNIITVDDVNLRVGINDTSPSYALDVTGEINLTGENLYMNQDDTGADVTIHFNTGRRLKWDHDLQRFELNGDTYISDDLTVDGGNINLNGTATAGVKPFLTFATQADGTNSMYGIRGMSTVDDPWFVGGASTGDDAGYLEIATGDNSGGTNSGGEIYVRQYSGESSGGVPWYGGSGTVQRTLTLLDNVGNTTIPNSLLVNDVLFVDSVNNRVGINNLSPNFALDVSGSAWIIDTLWNGDIQSSGENLSISAASSYNLNLTATNVSSGGDPTSLKGLNLIATTCDNPVSITRNTNTTDASTRVLALRAVSTGTPSINGSTGLGLGGILQWQVENASNVMKEVAYIDVGSTNLTAGSENFRMAFGLMNSGAAYGTRMELSSAGNLQIDGDLQVDGNEIKKSGGTTVVTFSGTNLTTLAGDIALGGNTIRNSASTATIELSGTNVEVVGDLQITGNHIKSSLGNTALTFNNTNVYTAFDLEVGNDLTIIGNEIKSSTGNVAITLTNTNVEAAGNLSSIGDITAGGSVRVNSNLIKSSGNVTAIALIGADVAVYGDLTVTGNEIKSSTGASAITLSTADVTIGGDLTVTGNDIKSSSATALTFSGADVTVAGDLTVTGNDIKSSGGTIAITLSTDDVTVAGNLTVGDIFKAGSYEDVANGATISPSTAASYFITGASNETSTLDAGTSGQFKSLMMRTDGGGNMVVNVKYPGWAPSVLDGYITFNDDGDSCLLHYINGKWYAVGANGVAFT